MTDENIANSVISVRVRSSWAWFRALPWSIVKFLIVLNNDQPVGKEGGFSQLAPLFTITLTSAVGFVVTVGQLPSGGWIAQIVYCITTVAIMLLCSLVGLSSVSQDGEQTRHQYNAQTIWGARVVSGLALVLLFLFVFLSWGEFLPGQLPKRAAFLSSKLPITLHFPGQPPRIETGATPDGDTIDDELLERFVRWFSGDQSAAGTRKKMVLIARQQAGFDQAFAPFSVVLWMRPELKFDDALVLVRRRLPSSTGGALKYRVIDWRWGDQRDSLDSYEIDQLPVPRKQSGEPYPVIHVPETNAGDSLIVLLRVEQKVEADWNTDPEWYQVQFRRVGR